MAVFLATAALIAGTIVVPANANKNGLSIVRGDLGGAPTPGPSIVGVAQGAEMVDPMILAANNTATAGAVNGSILTADQTVNQDFSSEGAIADPGNPIGPVFDPSGNLTYTIHRGDNLSTIAAKFNVSAADIMSANPKLNKKALRTGATIIIPNGAVAVQVATTDASLPNFNSDFIMPTQGDNYGILHDHNAVDIANSCGTTVVASAEGLVVPDPNIPDTVDGWNGGYGNFVLIEHPFGNAIYTRYAHLEQILVQPGDYVKQGQQIGLMGETGDATGCHLHFEVLGAQNPFAK